MTSYLPFFLLLSLYTYEYMNIYIESGAVSTRSGIVVLLWFKLLSISCTCNCYMLYCVIAYRIIKRFHCIFIHTHAWPPGVAWICMRQIAMKYTEAVRLCVKVYTSAISQSRWRTNLRTIIMPVKIEFIRHKQFVGYLVLRISPDLNLTPLAAF